MVVAREMGYSEAEFWASDPVFFNEIADAYYRKRAAEINAISPIPGLTFRR